MNTTHVLAAGVYTNKEYNLTQLQQLPIQMDERGNVRVTGSNVAPPLATYVFVTDGTNTQPTLDDKARGGYIYLTDGTNTAAINENNALKVVLTPTPQPMTANAVEAHAARAFIITKRPVLQSKNVDYNVLYFLNPVDSGKNIYVRKLSASNVSSANLFNISMNINPTVTSHGTATTINNTNIGSGVASVALAYNTNVVTSSTGISFASISGSGEHNTIDFDYGVILQPGNSILLQAVAVDNSQTIVYNFMYTEVSV